MDNPITPQELYDNVETWCHCSNCMALKPSNKSPEEWVSMAGGLMDDGSRIMLWCKRCELPIAIFALKEPMRGMKCAACGEELASLRQQLTEKDAEIARLETDNWTHENTIETAATELASLRQQLTEKDSEIAKLQDGETILWEQLRDRDMELASLRQQLDTFIELERVYRERGDELDRENRELRRADSERLDWLENQEGENLGTLHLSQCFSNGMGQNWFKKQIRAAIDKSREKEGK